jgi:hypothetical protein
MPLDGVSADEWLLFDTVLIVRDLFTGGNRSFSSTTDAQEFRAAVYNHYGEYGDASRCCLYPPVDYLSVLIEQYPSLTPCTHPLLSTYAHACPCVHM